MNADIDTKRRALSAAREMELFSAMALPRHERRKLAKINGMKRIAGSTKPLRNTITSK